MKKTFKIVCIVLLAVVLLCVAMLLVESFLIKGLGSLVNYWFESYVDEEFCNETKAYLETKYNSTVVVEDYTQHYEGAPAIIAHFESYPDVRFFSYKDYDFFLSSYLASDAEKIISQVVSDKIKADNVSCDLFYCDDEELWGFYEQNGRPLSWHDEECKETISRVLIYPASDADEIDLKTAQTIVEEIVAAFGNGTFEDCELDFVNFKPTSKEFDFDIIDNEIKYKGEE